MKINPILLIAGLTAFLTSHALAEPSLILSPQPGWNGWSVETSVRAGFQQHGGVAEIFTTDSAFTSITPGTASGAEVGPRLVGANHLPDIGAAKDKAEGSIGFTYTVGTAAEQDSFTFTLNSTTSATDAKVDFGAGPVNADAVFEAEIVLRTFAPIAPGVTFKLPDMPALHAPAPSEETMTAVFSGWAGASPLSGFILPEDAGFTVPLTMTDPQMFEYKLNYRILTPYGTDPTVTYTFRGGAAGQASGNLVPNGDLTVAGVVNPKSTTEDFPNASAAAEWRQSSTNGAVINTSLIPSTNTLAGSCTNMLKVQTTGPAPAAPALSNNVSIDLTDRLPVGSSGSLDILVVAGRATAGFDIYDLDTDTAQVDTGSQTASASPSWQHLRFTNNTQASDRILITLSGTGISGAGNAEAYIDNVTAHIPTAPRSPRYDYPGAFGPVTKWISDFAYPNQIPLVGDFNGDGVSDIVTLLRDAYPGQNGYVYVALNTGSGAFNFSGATSLWKNNFCFGTEIPAVGDFDGDGRDDLVSFNSTSGKVFVSLSSGSGFCESREWYPSGSVFSIPSDIPAVGDVNGDGLADIVAFAGNEIFVALNTGRSFANALRWQADFRQGTGVPHLGDVNGDGKADAVLFVKNSRVGIEAGDVEVALSNGSAFVYGAPRYFHANFAPNATDDPLLADLNGDGCADIITVTSTGTAYAAIATGVSFATGDGTETGNGLSQWLTGLRNPGEKPLVGHFNRDMNDDLCTFVFGLRAGADYAATYVSLCGNILRPIITALPAITRTETRALFTATVNGTIPLNWEIGARLIGPGNTIITPILNSVQSNGATWQLPGGNWPSGLYRFLVFDDLTNQPSSNAFPITLLNSWDAWRRNNWKTFRFDNPLVTSELADFDEDGLSNLEEFLMDTDPTEFTTSPVVWGRLNNGSIFHILPIRRDRAGTVHCQYGANLDFWNGGATYISSGNSISSGKTYATLTTPPNATPKFFSRLKFTRP